VRRKWHLLSEPSVTSSIPLKWTFHFEMDISRNAELICVSSGEPATDGTAADLTCYTSKGEEAAKQFINERLVNKTVKFHDPHHKLKLKNFSSQAVEKSLKSSQQKTVMVRPERNLLGQLLLFLQSNNISLQKLFQYSLSPIPWSIATGDGCLAKTNQINCFCIATLTQ
jgi:hypothetical protein